MENYLVPTITVSSYNGKIPLAKELLNVLDLPNEGILWKKTDQEYILFSETSWNKFVQKMKAETGKSDIYFEYNRDGRRFIRDLFDRAGTVHLKEKAIFLPNHTQKKLPLGGTFTIKIYR